MKITNFIMALFGIATFTCCGNNKSSTQNIPLEASSSNIEIVDDETECDEKQRPSLNDIRFKDWDSEWLDNEYIRTLRRYLNDVVNGKIIDDELDDYKSVIAGKFVIGKIEPYLLGGAFIDIIFIDNPSKMFTAWVYSDVDETLQKVTDYQVRSVRLTNEELSYTKEEILETIKVHPELKLW